MTLEQILEMPWLVGDSLYPDGFESLNITKNRHFLRQFGNFLPISGNSDVINNKYNVNQFKSISAVIGDDLKKNSDFFHFENLKYLSEFKKNTRLKCLS